MHVAERFWSKVDQTKECWEWQASIGAGGYGQFGPNSSERSRRAHRVAYELAIGVIPAGMCVCHICNNKKCVRPEHLYLATAKENTEHAKRDGLIVKPIKEFCKWGHPYKDPNIYYISGRRFCKQCSKNRSRRYRAKITE